MVQPSEHPNRTGDPGQVRRAELAEGLAAVRERITRACAATDRAERDVHLVAVTKFFPATDLEHLVRLGVGDLGESRDQEAADKVAELGQRLARDRHPSPQVHFVGQVQTNKARSVVCYADVVHSVDRVKLVRALDRATGAALEAGDRTAYLGVLVQLDLEEGERAGRGGVAPGQAGALADEVAAGEHLRLRGVMAVAPPDLDEAGLRGAFEQVARCAASLRAEHPDATWVSTGMSADLEAAVASGATHLRVGSAILGSRPVPR